jgi:hypothetical protein
VLPRLDLHIALPDDYLLKVSELEVHVFKKETYMTNHVSFSLQSRLEHNYVNTFDYGKALD